MTTPESEKPSERLAAKDLEGQTPYKYELGDILDTLHAALGQLQELNRRGAEHVVVTGGCSYQPLVDAARAYLARASTPCALDMTRPPPASQSAEGGKGVQGRCFVTGNIVGTDTWAKGHPCGCAACEPYARLEKAEAERDALRAEVERVREQAERFSVANAAKMRENDHLVDAAEKDDEWIVRMAEAIAKARTVANGLPDDAKPIRDAVLAALDRSTP